MSRQLHGQIELVRAFSIGPDLLGLPRSYDVAVVADFDSLEDVRAYAEQRCLVALNLGSQPQQVELDRAGIRGQIILSTHLDRVGERLREPVALRPDEGVIVMVE